MLPLLVELLFELSEALVIDLLRGEVVFEFLMELLHPGGQGGGALLAAAALAAFALQFGGGSCQGRDGGAEAAFELKELVLQGRLICAWSRRRGGRLLALGLGAFELLGVQGQTLLQFMETGFGFGSGLLLGKEQAIQLVAGVAGLRELLFQLGAPGRLCFQRRGGLLGRGFGGVERLVLLLEMRRGPLEVRSALTQVSLQFVEGGVPIGWNRWCGGSPRRKFILTKRRSRGRGRLLRCDHWGGGWRLGLGSRFGRGLLEDVRDALKGQRLG